MPCWPVQYQRILAHPEFDRYDLGSFKAKLSTSAPLRAQVKADCLARWPGRLIEIYGLTEGGGSCMLEANLHPDKLHTVGKPGFGVELKVLDEQGRELPQGEVGEIAGRAEMMMKGYYKQDDKTRELFWHDADGRLFFKSGDMGKLDEGFLILLDRKKDMIISGGFNVYAADIEVLLLKHPDVIDVAVIGVPSDQWGKSPMALCVRRAGATVGEEVVREWANGQLSKTQRLVAVEFRNSLPRSTIGKIMKRELRLPLGRPDGQDLRTSMTEPTLRSTHLFTLALQVDPNFVDVGETPYGRRRIATVTGGTFEGEELRGIVLPAPAGDWLLQRRDGILQLDVRLTLKTDDGHLVYMSYRGMRHGPAWVIEQLNMGVKVDPANTTSAPRPGSRRPRRSIASSTASSASRPAGAIPPGRSTRSSRSCDGRFIDPRRVRRGGARAHDDAGADMLLIASRSASQAGRRASRPSPASRPAPTAMRWRPRSACRSFS